MYVEEVIGEQYGDTIALRVIMIYVLTVEKEKKPQIYRWFYNN